MQYLEEKIYFDKTSINKIWLMIGKGQPLCENKEQEIKVKIFETGRTSSVNFPIINKLNCTLERIDDTLDYINTLELSKNTKCNCIAFDFMEFLNLQYIVVHCIEELAKMFQVNCESITKHSTCFSNLSEDRISSTDYDFFEYIRSLCAVHPVDTSFHPKIHGYNNFDCCSSIKWNYISDNKDLIAYVYSSKNTDEYTLLGLDVDDFVKYQNKWLKLMEEITSSIGIYIDKEKKRYREEVRIKNEDEFLKYEDYIKNLKKEYAKRCDKYHEYIFDLYVSAFTIELDNPENNNKLIKFQNALKIMFAALHKQLQEMEEYGNTGIEDLESGIYTNLFLEMYLPSVKKSAFANERSSFDYIDKLENDNQYTINFAREAIGKISKTANRYVCFKNTESADETNLLLHMALYFEALEDKDSYLERSIPKTCEYR